MVVFGVGLVGVGKVVWDFVGGGGVRGVLGVVVILIWIKDVYYVF